MTTTKTKTTRKTSTAKAATKTAPKTKVEIAAPKLPKAANDAAKKVVTLNTAATKTEQEYLDKRLALSVEVARFWLAAKDAGFANFKAAANACKVASWPGYDALKRLKSVGEAELEEKGKGAEKLAWLRMKSTEASSKNRSKTGANKSGAITVENAMEKIGSLKPQQKRDAIRTLLVDTGNIVVSKQDANELAEYRKSGAIPETPTADDVVEAFKSLSTEDRAAAFQQIMALAMSAVSGVK